MKAALLSALLSALLCILTATACGFLHVLLMGRKRWQEPAEPSLETVPPGAAIYDVLSHAQVRELTARGRLLRVRRGLRAVVELLAVMGATRLGVAVGAVLAILTVRDSGASRYCGVVSLTLLSCFVLDRALMAARNLVGTRITTFVCSRQRAPGARRKTA